MTGHERYLSDAWYADYSAGNMMLGEQVLMGAHLELSEAAAERVSAFDEVGGTMLASIEASSLRNGSFGFSADDIFDRIEQSATEEPSVTEADCDADTRDDEQAYVPQALQQFLEESGQKIRWDFLGPGLRKCMLWKGEDGSKLWMLRAQPGVSIPSHSHSGSELTLVLKGSFSDGEHVFARGDVEEADGSIEHEIQIGEGDECICLALTTGKLVYQNPLLKVFQVFTGL